MSDLEPAVRSVIGQCLGVREGENVVVVVDEATRDIGEALRAEASRAGAEAVLTVMDAREVDGQEPPAAVAAALAAADVFIAPTSRSLSHTRARKAASENGARGATLPGVTADLLARLMTADMAALQRRGRALAELLTEAGEAHFTCPRGSDFRMDLSGRTGEPDDGRLTERGAFGNLPCGEGFISPLTERGSITHRTASAPTRDASARSASPTSRVPESTTTTTFSPGRTPRHRPTTPRTASSSSSIPQT